VNLPQPPPANPPNPLDRRPLLLHLGCGSERKQGWVNVDLRPTPATDLVMDLSAIVLPSGIVRGVFSHAFFEHLRRSARVPHLHSIWHALDRSEGFVCYLGLPHFRNIARFYLERRPGITRPLFDLTEVYRYTHGDPEQVADYDAQLHRSLFDEEELAGLLRDAGFDRFLIFSYCFVNEALPVNLGFYAIRRPASPLELQEEALRFIRTLEGTKLRAGTIALIDPGPS